MVVKVRLQELKRWCEEYCRERGMQRISIEIHYTTALAKLEKIKANVQGQKGEYDILLSGELKGKEFLEALSHEVAHVVCQSDKHGLKFEEEKEKVKKWLEKKIKKEVGDDG